MSSHFIATFNNFLININKVFVIKLIIFEFILMQP